MKLSITRIIDVDRYIPTSILGDIKTKYTDVELYDFIDKYGKKSDSRSYPLGICCSVNKKGAEPIISVYTQVLVEIDNFLEVGSVVYLSDEGFLTNERAFPNQAGVGIAVNYKSNKSEELTNCIYVSCSIHTSSTISEGGGGSSSEDAEYLNKKIEELKQDFRNFISTVDSKIALKADKSTRLIAGQGMVINGSQDLSGDNEFISYGTGSGGGDGTIGTATIDFTDKSSDLFFIIKVEKGLDGYKEFMIQKIKDEDGFGSPNMMLQVKAITSTGNAKGAMYEIRYSNTYGENLLHGVQFYENDESVSVLVRGGYTYSFTITSTLSRNMTIRWGASFDYEGGITLSSGQFIPSSKKFWASRNEIITELVTTDSATSDGGIIGDDTIPETPQKFSLTSMVKGFFVNYEKPKEGFVKGTNIYLREKTVGYWRRIFTTSSEIFVKGDPNTIYEVYLRSESFAGNESLPTDILEVLSKQLASSEVEFPLGQSPEELEQANKDLNDQIEEAERQLGEGINGVTTKVDNLSKKITDMDIDTVKSKVEVLESEIIQVPNKISSTVSQSITDFDNNIASKKYSLIEQLPDQISLKVQSMYKEINEMVDGETVINRINQIVIDQQGIKLSGHSINIGDGIVVDAYGRVSLGTVSADKLVIGDNFYADADTGELRIKRLNVGLITGLEENLNQIERDLSMTNKTFTINPIPPYNVGDMWWNGEELWVCVVSRPSGSAFNIADWELGNESTLDSYARELAQEAKRLSEEATKNAISAQGTANTALQDAIKANGVLSDISSDNKVTPVEKQDTKKEWLIIEGEKPKIDADADRYLVSKSTYNIHYNNLKNYLVPILADLNSTYDLGTNGGNTFRTTFLNYYNARQDLLNSISEKAKQLSEDAKVIANNAQNTANSANQNASSALLKASEIQNKIDGGWVVLNANTVVNGTFEVGKYIKDSTITGVQIKNGTITAEKLVSETLKIGMISGLSGELDGIKNSVSASSVSTLGKMLYLDPTFEKGVNSIVKYDNNATGSIVHEIVTGQNMDNLPAPNNSNKILRISKSQGSVTSPAMGGFTFLTPSRARARFITKLTAWIPIGHKIAWASNSVGTGGKHTWLTSVEGKSAWAEYICEVVCGDSGTFATTNFYYLSSNDGNQTKAVTWALCYATVFDVNSNEQGWVSDSYAILNDLSADDKLTPLEKQEAKKEWDIIMSEYNININQANSFSVSTADYTSKYNTLNTYISPLLSNLTTTSTINGGTFRATFKAYYDSKLSLLNAIANVTRQLANTAQNTANTAQSTATTAQNTANTAQTNATNANNLLNDIANDNKLTASEKQEAKREWDAIWGEYSTYVAQANAYGVSATDYTNKYNTLNTYITPLLSNLGTTTDIVGSTFRTNFKNYYVSRQVLLNGITDKTKQLADNAQTSANNAQNTANTAQSTANNAQGTATNAQNVANEVKNTINSGGVVINANTLFTGDANFISTGTVDETRIQAGSITFSRNKIPVTVIRNMTYGEVTTNSSGSGYVTFENFKQPMAVVASIKKFNLSQNVRSLECYAELVSSVNNNQYRFWLRGSEASIGNPTAFSGSGTNSASRAVSAITTTLSTITVKTTAPSTILYKTIGGWADSPSEAQYQEVTITKYPTYKIQVYRKIGTASETLVSEYTRNYPLFVNKYVNTWSEKICEVKHKNEDITINVTGVGNTEFNLSTITYRVVVSALSTSYTTSTRWVGSNGSSGNANGTVAMPSFSITFTGVYSTEKSNAFTGSGVVTYIAYEL